MNVGESAPLTVRTSPTHGVDGGPVMSQHCQHYCGHEGRRARRPPVPPKTCAATAWDTLHVGAPLLGPPNELPHVCVCVCVCVCARNRDCEMAVIFIRFGK